MHTPWFDHIITMKIHSDNANNYCYNILHSVRTTNCHIDFSEYFSEYNLYTVSIVMSIYRNGELKPKRLIVEQLQYVNEHNCFDTMYLQDWHLSKLIFHRWTKVKLMALLERQFMGLQLLLPECLATNSLTYLVSTNTHKHTYRYIPPWAAYQLVHRSHYLVEQGRIVLGVCSNSTSWRASYCQNLMFLGLYSGNSLLAISM